VRGETALYRLGAVVIHGIHCINQLLANGLVRLSGWVDIASSKRLQVEARATVCRPEVSRNRQPVVGAEVGRCVARAEVEVT
jgi:hypothetical protein